MAYRWHRPESLIGPREFVQVGFDDGELTIEKIKDACLEHFAPQTGSNVVCEVLAGEQGLSRSHIKQVPDLKLIYVRFISGRSCARASRPNTISVTQMLKLGKVVESGCGQRQWTATDVHFSALWKFWKKYVILASFQFSVCSNYEWRPRKWWLKWWRKWKEDNA